MAFECRQDANSAPMFAVSRKQHLTSKSRFRKRKKRVRKSEKCRIRRWSSQLENDFRTNTPKKLESRNYQESEKRAFWVNLTAFFSPLSEKRTEPTAEKHSHIQTHRKSQPSTFTFLYIFTLINKLRNDFLNFYFTKLNCRKGKIKKERKDDFCHRLHHA